MVKIGTTSTSGTISVRPSNTCGNSVNTNSASITVNTGPAAVGSISGLTTVCKGLTSVTYSISSVANATSYNWTIPAGATVTSGAGTTSIVVSYAGATVSSGAVSVDAINSCATASKSITVTINSACQYVWNGTTSTDWSDGSNWSYGYVPTSTTDVLIPSGTTNKPVLTAASSAQSLTNNGTITLGSNTLNVYGNISNTGTFNASTGSTVAFAGSTAQTITGVPVLNNIIVNNAAGVSLQSAIAMNGTLSLTSGVLTTNSNLTINFDNGGNIGYTGSDNGSVSGTVKASRNLIAKTHYIASPFAGTTSAQVQACTPLYVNPYWKMYTKTFAAQGWAAVMDVSTAMPQGTGFSLSIPTPVPLILTGTYDHTFTLPGAPYSNAAAGKYILVGNPYPSTIDWNTIYNNGSGTTSNVGGAIYYWNAANSQVSSYTSGVGGTNGATQYVPAMQAFMVTTTGSGGNSSVAINNTSRISSQNASFFRTAQTNPTLKLYVKNTAGIKDETIVSFNDLALPEFESAIDAYKIMNGGSTPSLFTGSNIDATLYSINSLPMTGDSTNVPLNLKVMKDTIYEIHCSQFSSMSGYKLMLEDKLLKTLTVVDTSLVYKVSAKPSDNTNRFVLRMTPDLTQITTGNIVAESASGIKIGSYENNIMLSISNIRATGVNIEVQNSAGAAVQVISNQTIEPGIKILPLSGLASGVYLIKFNIQDAPYTGKVVITK